MLDRHCSRTVQAMAATASAAWAEPESALPAASQECLLAPLNLARGAKLPTTAPSIHLGRRLRSTSMTATLPAVIPTTRVETSTMRRLTVGLMTATDGFVRLQPVE